MDEIRLRKVVVQDMDLMYEWTNEEMVRRNSINTGKIEYEEHKKWFNAKINSNECDMYIYLANDEPVGMVRVDYKGVYGWISFSVDKEHRGKGHGKIILQQIEKVIRRTRPEIIKLAGIVKVKNYPSRRVFEDLQYVVNEKYEDKTVVQYEKQIS